MRVFSFENESCSPPKTQRSGQIVLDCKALDRMMADDSTIESLALIN